MDRDKFIYISTVCIALLAVVIIGRAITGFAGQNITRPGEADISNVAPTMGAVSCTATGTLTCDETTVYCSATATDTNGDSDFDTGSATGKLFHSSTTNACSSDDNDCLVDSSCDVTGVDGDNDVTVNCSYTFKYWAEPGDWVGYVTVDDNSAETATGEDTQSSYFATNIAINITETTIDFGTLSPGDTSGEQQVSIENCGNVMANLSVNGSDMTSGGNTITVDNIQFNSTDEAFTALSASIQDLAYELDDMNTSSQNWEYGWFKLTVPTGQPSGTYTNTIKFWSEAS